MSNIEKIRQEIERRKKGNMHDELPTTIGRYYEDRDLLAFIDSLPEEKPSEDLEEAALEYIQGALCDLDDGPTVGLAKEAFIAGVKWQRKQECDTSKVIPR